MSELSQFDIFSYEAITELSELIYKLLPQDVFVTVMYEELEVDSDAVSFGPDTNGACSFEAAQNVRRIDDVCDIMGEHPPWKFDTKQYPVMFFSIESPKNYYGVIAVTISRAVKKISDTYLAFLVFCYIEEHLPAPFVEDMDEPIGVRYIYGSITNPKFCFVHNPDGV